MCSPERKESNIRTHEHQDNPSKKRRPTQPTREEKRTSQKKRTDNHYRGQCKRHQKQIKKIESLLKATKASIALITETKLDKNQQINIKWYNWIGKNRNRNGGGVMILIKNTIAQQTKEDTRADEHADLETKWITLETRPKSIAIGVFYGRQRGERVDKMK